MHVTLQYIVSAGIQNPNTLASKVAAIPVDQELEFLNMTKTADTTVAGPTNVVRTVVLQTDAESEAMFPTDDQLKAATRGLLTGVLGLNTPGSVTALEPIVNP